MTQLVERSGRLRVALVGEIGSNELTGDLAIAGAVRLVADLGHAVVAVSSDPERTTRLHGVPSIPSDVSFLVAAAVREADLVVLLGDRLVAATSRPVDLARTLSTVSMARSAGTPVIPLGVRLASPEATVPHRLAQGLFGMLSPGVVVDEASRRAAEDLGARDAVVAPDLAFALPPPLVRGEDRIVVSLADAHGTRSQADDEVAALARSLDALSRSTRLPLRFVSLRPGRDDRLHRLVAEAMHVPTQHGVGDLGGVLAEFGQSRAVVTMHARGVAAAVLGGRPVVQLCRPGETPALDAAAGVAFAELGWGLTGLDGLVASVLGLDADVIDLRDEVRTQLVRHRAAVERSLHVV